MSFFKCKMCGGTIEFEEGATVGVCDSCGTKQTLPRLDDDRRANLYDRANHFRRNNEFDKASGIYEQILSEDTTDAEAYWSLVLCRYGIEYVEDPATRKRVPTVNRAQFTSIFDDDNYKSALRYADAYQRILYEEEANAINEIQKGILAISQKEDPFDVFICYKETDNNGRRTPDSVLATDLYHQLTQEGFKVFFARITLEDKLGSAYEPYIFAALNSAKVMVVLGTKPEYFKAVWVKNEWSRYLALVKSSGGKKVLIPAYRDMDPYDLPDEFSHLQAQDMSKLGFMQDLVRGIKKITKVDEPKVVVKETVTVNADKNNVNVTPLLKRAMLFLEDGRWEDADAYAEKALDQDPENAQAYLVKLLIELRLYKTEALANLQKPFDDSTNYQKAIRFGNEQFVSMLSGYNDQIIERNELERRRTIYKSAMTTMDSATAEVDYISAAEKFQSIAGYKDADALAVQCQEKAVTAHFEGNYSLALKEMAQDDLDGYQSAIRFLRMIPGYKDADELLAQCQNKVVEIEAENEAKRKEHARQLEEQRAAAAKIAKKRKKVGLIVAACVVVVIVFIIVMVSVVGPAVKQKKAQKEARERLSREQIASLADVVIGTVIKYGFYEQDNDKSNGPEAIQWDVLAIEGDSALVLSRYALDCKSYNDKETSVDWAHCSLRSWLNETFYKSAFDSNQQKWINSSIVTASENPAYGTPAGDHTIDKVFLLSIDEANSYLSTNSARVCYGTAYCYAQGAYKSSIGKCWWWLRTPGEDATKAAEVSYLGGVKLDGALVSYTDVAVRPAMWIKVDPAANAAANETLQQNQARFAALNGVADDVKDCLDAKAAEGLINENTTGAVIRRWLNLFSGVTVEPSSTVPKDKPTQPSDEQTHLKVGVSDTTTIADVGYKGLPIYVYSQYYYLTIVVLADGSVHIGGTHKY